jgi:hypothetical protein
MAVHDFSQLAPVMKRYAKSLPGAVEQAVRMIAQPGLDTMIDATPVDTTRAVSNWVVTHGSPPTSERPARVPGSVKGSGEAAAKTAMKVEGALRIKYFTLAIPMFISNLVPYIGVLEHGDSKHAPNNMFRRGVQRMVRTAKTIRILKMTEKKV